MRFKCARIHCSKFATGFRDKDSRDRHLNSHKRPFVCTDTDCFAYIVGYESQQGLEAHMKAFHQEQSKISFPSARHKKSKDIFEACERGNLEEVKRFHSDGARLDAGRAKNYTTPLYIATRAGHAHVCTYLMEQGKNPFQASWYEGTEISPFYRAIQQRNVPMIQLLIHKGLGFVNQSSWPHIAQCIATAILLGLSDALGPLLEHESCFKNQEMIHMVLGAFIFQTQPKMETAVWSTNSQPLHLWFQRVFPNVYHNGASIYGAHSIIKAPESIEYRACKRALFQSDNLHRAVDRGSYPAAMFLLDLADKDSLQVLDNMGRTVMHILAAQDDYSRKDMNTTIVQRIIQIDGGVSANTTDMLHNLPIHEAIANSAIEEDKVQSLISHTVNLNHRSSNGISVIERAIWAGRDDRLSMLLNTGRVNLFDRNGEGQTSFSAVVSRCDFGYVDILEKLLEADPTLAWTADSTEDRPTPLHHAMGASSLFDVRESRYRNLRRLLLSLPEVENVLRAFIASNIEGNAEACKELRVFAQNENLQEALEAMDRIGF